MNKVVIVTGSSKGLGASIIKEFAKNNYNVVICYNKNSELAKKLEQYIKTNYNVGVLTIKCDITNEIEINDMVELVIKEFGHIDVLVNNASLELNSEVNNKTKQDFIKVLDTNLVGPFLLSRLVANHMLKRKNGKIINIASNNAINKYDPQTLEYDASKAALISLTHNLAINYSPYINVNAVAPGWIMTEVVENLNESLDGMLEKEESKNILINRFVKKEEVSSLVYFLATNDAINNQVITIDGGTR